MRGAPSRPATQLKSLPAGSPRADRKSLLLGTALASTLLLGTLVVAPTPAKAVDCFAASIPLAGASGPITVINPR